MLAPGRRWQVEVMPDADGDASPVSIRDCATGTTRRLFQLVRSALIYWSPDGRNLIVLRSPGAGHDELLLFRLPADDQAADRLMPEVHVDTTVRAAVKSSIGRAREIQFYMLTFVRWTTSGAVVAVGGTSTRGEQGRMTPYCYGLNLILEPFRVGRVLSPQTLTAKYGTRCHEMP